MENLFLIIFLIFIALFLVVKGTYQGETFNNLLKN